jgi:hypothetical protein
MAEINKLSVEKALRAGDAKQSKDTLFNDKIDALGEEIERMRTQRLRSISTNVGVIKTIVEASNYVARYTAVTAEAWARSKGATDAEIRIVRGGIKPQLTALLGRVAD